MSLISDESSLNMYAIGNDEDSMSIRNVPKYADIDKNEEDKVTGVEHID
jgi:hypothetical protein